MASTSKEQIISQVKAPEFNTIINEICDKGAFDNAYAFFIDNMDNFTGLLKQKEVEKFCEDVYISWYYNIKSVNNKGFDELEQKDINAIKTTKELHPKYMGNGCFDFFAGEYVNYIQSNALLPLKIDKLDNVLKYYFIAIDNAILNFPSEKKFKIENRLYLHLETKYILEFVEEIMDDCYEENIPLVIKFANGDFRKDNVIIYSNYEYVEQIIDIIKNINDKSTFSIKFGTTLPQIVGRINDYIGFGEQPEECEDTYLSLRANAIQKIISISKNEILKELLIQIPDLEIVTKNNEMVTAYDFIIELIKSTIQKEITKKIADLSTKCDDQSYELSCEYEQLSNDIQNEKYQLVFEKEAKKMRKALTNRKAYMLDVIFSNNIRVTSNYNFLTKIFKTFSTAEVQESIDSYDKMGRVINCQLYYNDDTKIIAKDNEGNEYNAEEYLIKLFTKILNEKLEQLIKQERDEAIEQSGLLRQCSLRYVKDLERLKNKLNEDDKDAKDLILDLVFDFQRTIIDVLDEDVCVRIDGDREIVIDKSVKDVILNSFPKQKQRFIAKVRSRQNAKRILKDNNIDLKNITLNFTEDNVEGNYR